MKEDEHTVTITAESGQVITITIRGASGYQISSDGKIEVTTMEYKK